MKIAMVIGECPRGLCGVGDYAVCLADALRQAGVDAQIIRSSDWRVRGVGKVLGALHNFDLVHIQYPTFGFGYKLGPQALSLLRGCLVTIHEASQRRIPRKLSLLPFLARPKHVIFTSEFEKGYVTSRAPWIARISSIIPVPSNIQVFPEERARALDEIVYFGLILPRKGLEQVLELSRIIAAQGLALKVRIIGKPRPEHEDYFEKLCTSAAGLPVIWDLDLREEQVAERLALSSVAYLPFPDGASERRSSLKAALANGVAVITTMGAQTPEKMKGFLRFSKTPQDAMETAQVLLREPLLRAQLAKQAAEFLGQCTWEQVTQLHLGVYRELLLSESRTSVLGPSKAREQR